MLAKFSHISRNVKYAAVLVTLGVLATLGVAPVAAAATAAAIPAEWMPHDIMVRLQNLPKRYSCDDLWYKFHDVLLALGARADLKILTWRCENSLADAAARSPRLQLKFELPQALSGKQIRWSDVNAAPATVLLEPGHPASLDDSDCELLRQMKDTLLAELSDRVTSFQLACNAPVSHQARPHSRGSHSSAAHSVSSRPPFSLEVQALTPVAGGQMHTALGVETAGLSVPALRTSLPAHAHPATFGGGFQCDYGFEKLGSGCTPVKVPAHGFITSSGDDWACERGFRKNSNQCVRIVVPANAHLTDDSFGKGWECNPRFNDTGDACKAVEVPAHAHAIYRTFDADWECDPGYRRDGATCRPIAVPAHAYLAIENGEQGWQCERGYRLLDQSCVAVQVPPHAFLDDSGHSWRCERGFASQQGTCAAINLPRNSHLDFSGNAWMCNDGYDERGGQCVSSEGVTASSS